MVRSALIVLASGFVCVAALGQKPEENAKSGKELAALEAKLHGEWKGGACMGELTLRADGTFERRHYSPGNNRVTGTWAVAWDVLPPTLTLTYKTSDAPDRLKVGEILPLKVLQLDDAVLEYRWPVTNGTERYERMKK